MRQHRTSNNQTELLSIVQSIQRHLESTRKQQNRITPAIARTFAIKIDNSIRKNGSSAISSKSISTKIDYIARMLMGVSSGNLMNLSVSNKGGLLAKATLLKESCQKKNWMLLRPIWPLSEILLFLSHFRITWSWMIFTNHLPVITRLWDLYEHFCPWDHDLHPWEKVLF